MVSSGARGAGGGDPVRGPQRRSDNPAAARDLVAGPHDAAGHHVPQRSGEKILQTRNTQRIDVILYPLYGNLILYPVEIKKIT